MARNSTKKATTKAKAPAPAPEATQEAHLDPTQLRSMDDASLQQLARDMGLDPAAYPDREALTAAIAEVPVIPGPPEPEGQEDTSAAQEGQETPQEPPSAQEGQDNAPQGQDGQGSGQEAPEGTPEPFTPYEATVVVPLVVIRRGATPNPEDKPIGTMARGARVTVTASLDGYAMLANGTYVKEVYLERVTP